MGVWGNGGTYGVWGMEVWGYEGMEVWGMVVRGMECMGNGGMWNGGMGAVPVESSASPQCSSDSPERGGM